MPVTIAIEFGAATDITWIPLTCQVYGLGWSRGATEDRGALSVPDPGELTAYLIDQNRDLDPENAVGLYAGAIDIGARLRVVMGGVTVFSGRIETIAHDLNPPDSPGVDPLPLARLTVVDNVVRAAAVYEIDNPVFPQEATGSRVTRLLDAAEIATGARDIEAGGAVIAAGELVNDVWSDMLAVVQNELGSIEFKPNGTVVFRTRSTVWSAPVAKPAPGLERDPKAVYLQLGCLPGALPLSKLRLVSDRSTVRNRISGSAAGGTPIVVEDQDSIDRYGLRATSRGDLLVIGDAARDAWVEFFLRRMKNPSRAMEEAQVVADNAKVVAIEAVPLFTGRVHVYQEDYGPPIDRTMRMLGVSWVVDQDANATATLVLGGDFVPESTLRRYDVSSDAEWIAAMGASSGTVGWAISSGAIRTSIAGEVSISTGGIDYFILTWTSDL